MWIAGILVLTLTGCGQKAVLETVDDVPVVPVMASPARISVALPEEAAAPVLEEDGLQVYLCDGYEIFLENRPSGDLQKTLRHLTGYDADALTVIKTGQGSIDRYEFVWTCAGEEGQRIGRAAVLDDGHYHYCLSVLRDGDVDPDGIQGIFASFALM